MRFSRKIPPGPSDPPPPRRLIDVATNDEGRLRDDRSGISSPIRPIPPHGVRPGPQLYPLASGRGGCVPGGVSHPAGEAPCPREGAPLAGPGGGQPLPGSAYLPLAQAAGERRHGPGAADLRDAGRRPACLPPWGRCPPTAGPCSTCAITRGSRWPSWPASSAPPPRRSPPGSTGPNNNSGRSWRNSAMKKLYQRTFEQVLAQTCPPLNRWRSSGAPWPPAAPIPNRR